MVVLLLEVEEVSCTDRVVLRRMRIPKGCPLQLLDKFFVSTSFQHCCEARKAKKERTPLLRLEANLTKTPALHTDDVSVTCIARQNSSREQSSVVQGPRC